MIVVQRISVMWTKQSRGGKGAQLRNSVPNAFTLPLIGKPENDSVLMCHNIKVDEKERFDHERNRQVKFEEIVPQKKFFVGACRLILEKEKLSAIYIYSATNVGAPQREFHPKTVLNLTPDTWGRVIYNGRFGWDSEWWYRKTVLNIGWFTGEIPENVFLGEPQHTFSDLADLR